MGIKNITKLLKARNQTGIKPKHISDYAGKKIAIDFSNYMYKFVYHIKKNNYHKHHYIESMFNLITKLRQYNITPFFVYDGVPPQEKFNEIQRRIAEKQKRENKISNIVNDIMLIVNDAVGGENVTINISDATNGAKLNELIQLATSLETDDSVNDNASNTVCDKAMEIDKLSNQCLYVTNKHKKYCAALFRYLGVPYIYSGKEADDMCGFLYKNGYVDACLSEDTDMLAHGVGVVLRDYNFFTGTLNEYNLTNICTDLDIEFPEFLDMCILCGTDYHKIKNLGPKRSYNIIKEYGSIEDAMVFLKKRFNISPHFDHLNIRSMFNGYDNSIDYHNQVLQNGSIVIKEPRYDKLLKLLRISCGMDLNQTDIKSKMYLK